MNKLCLALCSIAAFSIGLSSTAWSQSANQDGGQWRGNGLIVPAQSGPQNSEWRGTVAAGAGAVPEFDGAEDFQAIPFLAVQAQKGPYWVQLRGLQASANILPSRQWNAGPVINYRFGRDDDVDNDTLALLREVDQSIELGGFVSYTIPNIAKPRDALILRGQMVQDVAGGHEGFIASASAAYSRPITDKFRLTGSLSSSYGSDDYFDTFFTIDADNAARSGLNQFDAEAGLRDVGLTFVGNYNLTDQWGLIGVAGYSRLMGDAADSSIVEQEGSENQGIFALGVSYSF